MDHAASELSDFAKRMVAMSSLGIHITQDSGHRYITVDLRETICFVPNIMSHEEFKNIVSDDEPLIILKEYGSFASCLNRIDTFIFPETLLTIYQQLDYGNTIIGTAKVE